MSALLVIQLLFHKLENLSFSFPIKKKFQNKINNKK